MQTLKATSAFGVCHFGWKHTDLNPHRLRIAVPTQAFTFILTKFKGINDEDINDKTGAMYTGRILLSERKCS